MNGLLTSIWVQTFLLPPCTLKTFFLHISLKKRSMKVSYFARFKSHVLRNLMIRSVLPIEIKNWPIEISTTSLQLKIWVLKNTHRHWKKSVIFEDLVCKQYLGMSWGHQNLELPLWCDYDIIVLRCIKFLGAIKPGFDRIWTINVAYMVITQFILYII